MIVYCNNLECEFNDEGECAEIDISIDHNGECMSFCMKEQVQEDENEEDE